MHTPSRLPRLAALFLLALLIPLGPTACGESAENEHEDHHDDHDHNDHHADFVVMLFDTSNDEVYADVHGDHWHGELPELYVGDELEVGVSITDAEGNPIEPGGGYTLRVSVTEASPEGIVAIALHGDHVDIEALSAGEVALIVEILHDGELEFTSPELALSIGE